MRPCRSVRTPTARCTSSRCPARCCASTPPRSPGPPCQAGAVRYVIYGAGAVGGAIGGRLFQSGHDVVLIARGAHHDAMASAGLVLETADGTVTLPVPVTRSPAEAEVSGDDVVLLTMKTQDTAAALGELAATVGG